VRRFIGIDKKTFVSVGSDGIISGIYRFKIQGIVYATNGKVKYLNATDKIYV
jgi:hypothetical protein